MKKWLVDNFTLIFVTIVAIDLYANSSNNFTLNLIFKPLIVISLIVYLFTIKKTNSSSIYSAASGLTFSLLGDVLLIFQAQHTLFFIGGLVSFLIGHIFYIVYYIHSSGATNKTLKNKALYFILILLYGACFYSLLFNKLNELKIPVLLYTCVLMGMSIFAINRYGKVNSESFKLILTGAILFTISDSILALNKFLSPIPLAGVWIMASYAAAQYYITKGVLANKGIE
ncbi:MAG: lysoplasmalogenase [Bacteroidia bacterium]